MEACTGITLVGKFVNQIMDIEKNYSSNKRCCQMVK